MKKTNIQHRIILNDGRSPNMPKDFQLGENTYRLIGESGKSHLIPDMVPAGVNHGGFVKQIVLLDQNDKWYESYIYFYKKIEGKWCAVVETIEDSVEYGRRYGGHTGMMDIEVPEGLRKYREDMLDKQRNYLELIDSKADERKIALASELFRLASDAYAMAREDGLAE